MQTKISADTAPSRSLEHVLLQSEQAQELVDECAEELSAVNSALKHQFSDQHPPPMVSGVLEKSVSVESKAQDAAAKLAIVNEALESEIKERHRLERRLISANEREEAARHAAFHDPLTGLANRVLFNERLEHGLARAKRYGLPLAVMFIDLDEFKRINDSHGHDIGDIVLLTIATRLTATTRGDDTVSRQGGDEFLYLFMEMQDEAAITLVAEKLIKAIREPCEVAVGDLVISPSISASIGIAIFPKNGTTKDELVSNADKAMYRAKRSQSGYVFAQ